MDPLLKQRLLGLRSADRPTIEYAVGYHILNLREAMHFAAHYGLVDLCMRLFDDLDDGTFQSICPLITAATEGGHANMLCALFDRIGGDRRTSILSSMYKSKRIMCRSKLRKVFSHWAWTRYTDSDYSDRVQVFEFVSRWGVTDTFVIYECSPCLKIRAEDVESGYFLENMSYRWSKCANFKSARMPRMSAALAKVISDTGVHLDEDIYMSVEGNYEEPTLALIMLGFPVEYLVGVMSSDMYLDFRQKFKLPFSLQEINSYYIIGYNYEAWDGEPLRHLESPLVSNNFFSEYNVKVDLFNADLDASRLKLESKVFDALISNDSALLCLDLHTCTDKMKRTLIMHEPYVLDMDVMYDYFHRNGLHVTVYEAVIMSRGFLRLVIGKMLERERVTQEDLDESIKYCEITDQDRDLRTLVRAKSRTLPIQVAKDTFVREIRKHLPEVLVRMAGDYLSMEGFY